MEAVSTTRLAELASVRAAMEGFLYSDPEGHNYTDEEYEEIRRIGIAATEIDGRQVCIEIMRDVLREQDLIRVLPLAEPSS